MNPSITLDVKMDVLARLSHINIPIQSHGFFNSHSYPVNPVPETQQVDTGIQYFEEKTMNNSVLKKAISKVIGLIGVAALSSSLHAASFDCAKAAAPIEKLICSDKTTSKLDADLAAVYKTVMEKTDKKDELKQRQRIWLKETRNACKDVACVVQIYQARIAELNAGGQPHVPALEKVAPTAGSGANDSSAKKPVSIKFVYGDSYPICKPYLDMLNAARYTEAPACERKILPQFPQFKSIDWIEITDKNVIEKEVADAITINYAIYKKLDTPDHKSAIWNLKKMIDSNSYRFYRFDFDINNNDQKERIYRIYEDAGGGLNEYMYCKSHSAFYVRDYRFNKDNVFPVNQFIYNVFSSESDRDVFIFKEKLYLSSWSGKYIYEGSNIDIYSVDYKRICGFLVK